MAHSLKDLDAFITGQNDPNAPFNQPDEPLRVAKTLEGALLDDSDIDRAIEILSEIQQEVNALREYAKDNENIYLLKRLNSIYNKL